MGLNSNDPDTPYDPDYDWRQNKSEYHESNAQLPVDFFDDIGAMIVRKHNGDRRKIEKYLEGLSNIHGRHVNYTGSQYEKDLATLFTEANLTDLQFDISEAQGTWNKTKRKELGQRTDVHVGFYDKSVNGSEVAQWIHDGIARAL